MSYKDFFTSYKSLDPPPIISKAAGVISGIINAVESLFEQDGQNLDSKNENLDQTQQQQDLVIDSYLTPPSQNNLAYVNMSEQFPDYFNFGFKNNQFLPSDPNKPQATYNMSSDGTFNNKSEFINALNNTYRQVLLEKGLDPNYSYVLTASAVMESGWGTKVSGKFNYGGVKSKKGSVKSTIDYVNGNYIRRNQTFRDFSSIKDYCNYVVNLLSGEKYYHNAFSKFSADQPLQFWRYVLDSGYGGGDSDHKSKYVESIRKIINTIKSNTSVVPMQFGYNYYGQSVSDYTQYFERFLNTPQNIQSKQNTQYYNTSRKVDLNSPLIHIDIEDLLKQQGITSVNGKAIKFGRRGLRPKGSKYGSKNSWHYVWNPYTKSATARDISIINGSDHDYDTFRKMLLGNKTVVSWMKANGWGIINELTKEILSRTKGTGRHFHFGPDSWARRTWNAWLSNPNIPVTKRI